MTSRIWARIGNLSYRCVAESIGIEPNTRRYISLSRRTLSPSRFTFRIVLMTGYDPITSCVSDKCSTNWATWAVADQAGLEPTIPWLTVKCFTIKLLILLWERRDSNPQGFRDRFTVCWANQLLNSPFCTLYRDRTCDLLYVRQPLLPSELRVLVLVFLYKSNHFLV